MGPFITYIVKIFSIVKQPKCWKHALKCFAWWRMGRLFGSTLLARCSGQGIPPYSNWRGQVRRRDPDGPKVALGASSTEMGSWAPFDAMILMLSYSYSQYHWLIPSYLWVTHERLGALWGVSQFRNSASSYLFNRIGWSKKWIGSLPQGVLAD